jgi:DNA segregation ATPase FtsK/SpoIIIE-like protein
MNLDELADILAHASSHASRVRTPTHTHTLPVGEKEKTEKKKKKEQKFFFFNFFNFCLFSLGTFGQAPSVDAAPAAAQAEPTSEPPSNLADADACGAADHTRVSLNVDSADDDTARLFITAVSRLSGLDNALRDDDADDDDDDDDDDNDDDVGGEQRDVGFDEQLRIVAAERAQALRRNLARQPFVSPNPQRKKKRASLSDADPAYAPDGGAADAPLSPLSSDEPGGAAPRPQRMKELKRASKVQRACTGCGTSDTPSWRRGADGMRTLCNACGLQYIRRCKKEARLHGVPSVSTGSPDLRWTPPPWAPAAPLPQAQDLQRLQLELQQKAQLKAQQIQHRQQQQKQIAQQRLLQQQQQQLLLQQQQQQQQQEQQQQQQHEQQQEQQQQEQQQQPQQQEQQQQQVLQAVPVQQPIQEQLQMQYQQLLAPQEKPKRGRPRKPKSVPVPSFPPPFPPPKPPVTTTMATIAALPTTSTVYPAAMMSLPTPMPPAAAPSFPLFSLPSMSPSSMLLPPLKSVGALDAEDESQKKRKISSVEFLLNPED